MYNINRKLNFVKGTKFIEQPVRLYNWVTKQVEKLERAG